MPMGPPYNRPPATCHPDRAHYAKGLCQSCYTTDWKRRHPKEKAPRVQRVDRGCSVEGCERKHNSHGLCAMHGLRLARSGNFDPGAFTYSETGLCTVPGCDHKHAAKGFCSMHYQRAKDGRLDLAETLTCDRCGQQFPRPYKSNPDVVRFCSHECRYADQLDDHRANRVARAAYILAWRKRNPEMFKANLLRRDAAKRGNDIALVTGRDLKRLIQRYGGRCAYCGSPYKHFDHVIPLSRGGRHAIGNLLPACAACNLGKGAKLLAEWRLLRPVPRRFRRASSRQRQLVPSRLRMA